MGACVADPEKTDDDCMDIVEEVFTWLQNHEDQFERLDTSTDEVENVESSVDSDSDGADPTAGESSETDIGGAETHGAAADSSGETSTENASSGIRRRLYKLLA